MHNHWARGSTPLHIVTAIRKGKQILRKQGSALKCCFDMRFCNPTYHISPCRKDLKTQKKPMKGRQHDRPPHRPALFQRPRTPRTYRRTTYNTWGKLAGYVWWNTFLLLYPTGCKIKGQPKIIRPSPLPSISFIIKTTANSDHPVFRKTSNLTALTKCCTYQILYAYHNGGKLQGR